MEKRITISNIIAYLQGNWRYFCYDNPYFHAPWLRFLLRKHIREQIRWRLDVMNPECYQNGECVLCGCATPALQMANKACKKPCYPKMMGKKEWKDFRRGEVYLKSSIKN